MKIVYSEYQACIAHAAAFEKLVERSMVVTSRHQDAKLVNDSES